MKILLCLLFILLIAISSSTHTYHVWKKKDYKTLKVQILIISIAIVAGILFIYDIRDPSIASLLNKLSPLEQ